MLATGSSDELVNLYSIASDTPARPSGTAALPTLLPAASTSTRNRELGSLAHHAGAVSALVFPGRAKLLTAGMDNVLAVARTSDWVVLSKLKAPIPRPTGRPAGDTAAAGEVPAGIAGIAVHPSAKLALSVGLGEKCMRLWNLVTGKKAGVLSFERDMLTAVGEGRWRGGEGRSVAFAGDGDEFVVGFERGAVVFALDCTVKGVARPSYPLTKVCQAKFLPKRAWSGMKGNVLALATEDGRIVFFDSGSTTAKEAAGDEHDGSEESTPRYRILGTMGEVTKGNRIKDFEVLSVDVGGTEETILVTGSSDGAVRIWRVDVEALAAAATATLEAVAAPKSTKSFGDLLATHDTARRITCLTAFVMDAGSMDEADCRENGEHIVKAEEVVHVNGSHHGADGLETTEHDPDGSEFGGYDD